MYKCKERFILRIKRTNDYDKRKGTCRKCKKEVNTEDVRRKYGSCSVVYMLSYCSAQCYTKDVTE